MVKGFIKGTLSLISSNQTWQSHEHFFNSTETLNLTTFNFYWWTKDHSFNYQICYMVLVCCKGLHWPVLSSHDFFPNILLLVHRPPPHSNQVAAELGQPGKLLSTTHLWKNEWTKWESAGPDQLKLFIDPLMEVCLLNVAHNMANLELLSGWKLYNCGQQEE